MLKIFEILLKPLSITAAGFILIILIGKLSLIYYNSFFQKSIDQPLNNITKFLNSTPYSNISEDTQLNSLILTNKEISGLSLKGTNSVTIFDLMLTSPKMYNESFDSFEISNSILTNTSTQYLDSDMIQPTNQNWDSVYYYFNYVFLFMVMLITHRLKHFFVNFKLKDQYLESNQITSHAHDKDLLKG
jgi:hypothetical protein